jgi:hypothetical protein
MILGLGLRIEKRLRLDQRLDVAAEPGRRPNTSEARYVMPAPLRILNTRLLYRPTIQGKIGQSPISDGGTKLAARCGGANP